MLQKNEHNSEEEVTMQQLTLILINRTTPNDGNIERVILFVVSQAWDNQIFVKNHWSKMWNYKQNKQ